MRRRGREGAGAGAAGAAGALAALGAAGLTRAMRAAIAAAAVAALVTLYAPRTPGWWGAVPWVGEVVLVSVMCAYARRLLSQAGRERSRALADLDRLRAANDLLSELHRLTGALPVSLDLRETAASIGRELRALLVPDCVVLLTPAPEGEGWDVVFDVGAGLAERVAASDLPGPLAAIAAARATVAEAGAVGARARPATGSEGRAAVVAVAGASLSVGAQWALYEPLAGRGGETTGLVAMEWCGNLPERPGPVEVLEGLGEHAALALDNARSFARLQRDGAAERAVIAHDLHDHLGQSLAFIGIELERLAKQRSAAGDEPTALELARLRSTVRDSIGELRGALHHLRRSSLTFAGAEGGAP